MEQRADSSPARTGMGAKIKILSLWLVTCSALSSALLIHPEKDNEEDANLVQVTAFSISGIYGALYF